MYTKIEDNKSQDKLGPSKSLSVHKLNSEWTLWYASRKEKDRKIDYTDRLQAIGSFSSIEDFFKFYMYIKSASEIERNTDLALFKTNYKPLWESCPNSAMWFVRYKKHEEQQDLDIKWEKLMFALLGEQFEEPNIIGALLSIRGKETIIEVWFNYNNNDGIKNRIFSNLNMLLDIDHTNFLYFKDNQISLKVFYH